MAEQSKGWADAPALWIFVTVLIDLAAVFAVYLFLRGV